MGAQRRSLTESLVANSLDGTDRHPAVATDPAAIRQAQQLFRSRLDGIAVFLTGPANVIFQLSWPEVGHGVVESKVESGQVTKHPFKRFRTTIGYVGIAILGPDELRSAFREAVNAQHRQVRSGPDSPVQYNAFNRDLQLWVASCLFYAVRDVMIRMHGPLTDEQEALLLALGARFGTTLQVPQDMWHRDMDEFWTYWEAGMARCRIDPPVHDYFHHLLHVRFLPFPLNIVFDRPMFWFNAGFLAPELRDQLDIGWTEQDQNRHDRVLRILGRVSRPLPGLVRQFPINAMVLNIDIRRRLGLKLA
jgi:uncharacterized protein (DUF2236 family)